MSGRPDPKPVRAEKRSRRRKDPLAVKRATLADRECWGCGRDGANGHHIIAKGFSKPGPDEPWNTANLCGSGSSGCHGAYHGQSYTTEAGERITPTLVRARIAFRIVRDLPRLRAIWEYLGASTLREQFFVRQLGMRSADVDELQRRHNL